MSRGITVAHLREILTGLDDHAPVLVRRGRLFKNNEYENPDEPEAVWVRRAIHGLVLEIEDHDIPDLVKMAFDNEDKASRVEDAESALGKAEADLETAMNRIEQLEQELARLKSEQAVAV